MIKIYFKTTFRSLWKNKGYSFLNIFGLSIGIACAALIFLWSENEFSWDNNHEKKDRLYAIRENATYAGFTFTNWSTPRAMASSLRTDIPGIVNTCRVSDEAQNLLFNIGDKSMYAAGRYADSSIFSMFTLPFTEGNKTTAFNQLHSIVITQATAKKFFANENTIIGKTVRVDNKQDYIVTGVLKDQPENSSLQFEWLIPYEVNLLENNSYKSGDAGNWGSYGPFTYVELKSSLNLQAINRQLYHYIHSKDATQTTQAFLFPMHDWHLYDEFSNGKQTGGGGITQVRLLSIIAWIILLIACINFMNLATARTEKRAKEVGVRKVLGSGKRGLVVQFLGEALLMSAMAAITAIIMIAFFLPAFNELAQKRLSLQSNLTVHITALLVIIIVCGLVAGSYPSLYLSSFNPLNVLKGLKIKTGSAAVIRKGLVVLQFAVSVVFSISTVVVYLQIQHVKSRNLGFNKDRLIEINLQHAITSEFPLVKQDLLHTGFVQNAAMADHAILYGGNDDDGFRWEGKSPNDKVSIAWRMVSPEFLATSGMKIIAGRDFDPGKPANNNTVIINESLARLMGNESAVGKIIQSPRGQKPGEYKDLTVSGVVNDYVFGNIYGRTPQPLLLFCEPSGYADLLYVRLNQKTSSQKALAAIQAVIKKENPAYPFQYKFVDEQYDEMFSGETKVSKLSTVFAGLAIIISCLGLFGLASYTAERRTKEIGIRKVLGANVGGITALLSKEFLQLVVIACIISFPVAWWVMHNWLQGYEYRIGISWWIFLGAGSAATLVALATISFQSVKAAIANPIKSLRTE